MDIQDDKDFAALLEVTKLYQACKERDLTIAEREYLKGARYAWQAAKANAVPEWFDYTEQSPQVDRNYQIFIKGEQITAKWVSRFGFVDPIEGDALRQELITHWAMQPQPPSSTGASQ